MDKKLEKKKLQLVIDGFLSGDSKQFQLIKTKATQYIYHQNFGSDIDKDELISEVLEILLENLRNKKFYGDSISALSVYIYQIIRFRINRIIRRREKLTYTDDSFDYIESASLNPSDETSNKELVDKIYKILDPKCADLLKLKFLENWLDQEIADHLDLTKNSASTAISRCLKKIREFDFVNELL